VVYIKEQVSQLRGALDPLPQKKRPFAECAERDGSNTQLALRTGGKWEIYVRVYQNEFEIKDKTNTNNPLLRYVLCYYQDAISSLEQIHTIKDVYNL
jgi:hypothetical protein